MSFNIWSNEPHYFKLDCSMASVLGDIEMVPVDVADLGKGIGIKIRSDSSGETTDSDAWFTREEAQQIMEHIYHWLVETEDKQ